MVFSFFKKKDKPPEEKMPERPAARPRPLVTTGQAVLANTPAAPAKAQALPDLVFSKTDVPARTAFTLPSAVVKPAAPSRPLRSGSVQPAPEANFTMSEFERNFTESSVMAIDVEHGSDPLQADIEQVAVLFANGQDAAARSLLDVFVRTNEGEEAQRFWWMYFDLLQLSGERDAFEQLGQRFTGQYAISPPIWPTTQQAASGLDAPILPTDAYYLNGDIRNCKFEELKPVFAKHRLPILDFAAVRRMDFFSAGQLANRLSIFKHGGREIVIRSPNHLLAELMGVVGINKTARILIPKL